jgi:hypothetical protein
MKAISTKPSLSTAPLTPVERGKLAAKAMAKELVSDHKRWNLPLLSWKDGKIIATKP